MVEAYRLESKVAQYPRIIISEHLKQEYDANIKHYISNYTTFNEIPSQDYIFTQDEDGWYYLDYIHPNEIYLSHTNIHSIEDYHSVLSDILKKGLASNSDRVVMKYRWLERKLRGEETKTPAIGNIFTKLKKFLKH